MFESTVKSTPQIDALLAKLADDPWALPHAERRELLDALTEAQVRWLPRLAGLVEPPMPAQDFPAFLLETSSFAGVRYAVEAGVTDSGKAETAALDLVQHFVDHYRNYIDV